MLFVWSRSVSPQDGGYNQDRYSRSPPYSGSRSRSRSLDRGQGKSRSRSPSPRRSRSQSLRRSRSHNPRSPIKSRSQSPNHEEYKRELNGERSPSQWCCAAIFFSFLCRCCIVACIWSWRLVFELSFVRILYRCCSLTGYAKNSVIGAEIFFLMAWLW